MAKIDLFPMRSDTAAEPLFPNLQTPKSNPLHTSLPVHSENRSRIVCFTSVMMLMSPWKPSRRNRLPIACHSMTYSFVGLSVFVMALMDLRVFMHSWSEKM